MGLNSNEMKLYIVGYDCGIENMEVVEIVCSHSFEEAIQYAENAAHELYEDLELAPSPLEFDGSDQEYENFREECSLNAIGFWCREYDVVEDNELLREKGFIEI